MTHLSPLKRVLNCITWGSFSLVVSGLLALVFGSERASLFTAMKFANSADHLLIVELRLPRVLLAAFTGAALSTSGLALQASLRNPIAEPYVLGVSGGAALGATLALVFSSWTSFYFVESWSLWLGLSVTTFAALVGGFSATLFVLYMARKGQNESAQIVCGFVVNAIAGSLITFLKTISTPHKSQELLFWLTGFLSRPGGPQLFMLACCTCLAFALLLKDSPKLNALTLGREKAQSLGIDAAQLERRTLLLASFLTGAVVSLTGLIGFVGLIVPHVLRRFFGADLRILFVASFLFGASVLVLCDLMARVAFLFLRTELPVGSVTALFGGPLFLFLLATKSAKET